MGFMLHSDQSCPDTPVRLDSRTGIDPRERKIEKKKHKKSACWSVSSFFSNNSEYLVATSIYTAEAFAVQQYSLADINRKPL